MILVTSGLGAHTATRSSTSDTRSWSPPTASQAQGTGRVEMGRNHTA
jgi:hypothetical protein